VFVVAYVLIAAAGAMFVFVVVVALVFVVVCSAVSLPLLKCSHHRHHHHHQHLHNLKDGYNSVLNSPNFVLIILAPYVNFSLNWEKSFKISTES